MRKGHPLQNVRLSRRLDQNAYHPASARSPLATAVDLRTKLLEAGWSVIIEDADRLLISERWNRPYRAFTLDEATALLNDWAVMP